MEIPIIMVDAMITETAMAAFVLVEKLPGEDAGVAMDLNGKIAWICGVTGSSRYLR